LLEEIGMEQKNLNRQAAKEDKGRNEDHPSEKLALLATWR
jgi:hypothetical protein